MKTIKLVAMAALIIFSVSCVANKPYRVKNSIDHVPPDPPLAFIEFDDMGELHDPCKGLSDEDQCQLNNALNEIDKQKRSSPNLVVITFIHGWKNNAEEKNKNVLNFKQVLKDLRIAYPRWSFMGVYLGWRGKLTRDPITSQLSFWNRRQAAKRVGTVSMTETILRLMHRTKEVERAEQIKKQDYKFIIVGHSFGGLILERAMGQALTGWVTTELTARPCENNRGNDLCFTSPADLVVLLNPALESIETRQLIEMLQRQDITVDGDRPFLVSITAQNDWATGKVLPFGHFIEAIGKNFRKRKPKDSQPNTNPCEGKAPSQSQLYTRTAGHLPYFFSHDVQKTPCESKDRVLTYSADKRSATQPTKQSTRSSPKETEQYYVCRKPASCNDTPYWIMNVEPEIINGHSGIWREPLQNLLISILGRSVLGDEAQRQSPETVLRYKKY